MRERRALAAALLAATIVVLAGLCQGCSLFPDRTPAKIHRSVNNHAYYEALYERQCVRVVGPAWCKDARQILNDWKADAALTTFEDPDPRQQTKVRAGERPLLLKLLKDDEAKAKKVLK